MGDFCSSDLWTSINANKDIVFESFRELLNKLNGRLAAHDRYDLKSFRYFKNIFFNTPVCMTDEFFELYDKALQEDKELHLIERHNLFSPMVIDIDEKYSY